MRNILFTVPFFLLFSITAMAQQNIITTSEVDSLYREDQFYIGLTYNILINIPEDISSEGFSGGMHAGFIRDMPLNERRNVAIAVGLGYSVNKYGYNLFVGEQNDETVFVALDNNYTYDINRFVTHEIELPIELRWRTSTASAYRFWRVYGGLKLGYVYYYKATFEQPGNRVIQTDIPEFNRLRTSAMINFGYNTFNFQVQYNFNPFFNKNSRVNDQPIDLSTVKLGLIFYIL